MIIYYVLIAVAVVVIILVLTLIIITLKNIKKNDNNEDKQPQKEEVKWDHIKDFVDINRNRIEKLNNYSEYDDEDVMTTGVGLFPNKDSSDQKRESTSSSGSINLYNPDSEETKNLDMEIYNNDRIETVPLTALGIEVILNYNDGNGNKVLKMTSDKLTVGRDVSNDLILWNNEYLSRFHAEFTIIDNKLYLTDKKSKNGTYVDSKKIEEKVEITKNCNVKFGNTVVSVTIENKLNG